MPFGKVGFSLAYKQAILKECIEHDTARYPKKNYNPCLGRKKLKKKKSKDHRESDEKLDERLRGNHFNAYWQICKKLGCPRTPKRMQALWDFDAQEALMEEAEEDGV